MIPNLLIYPKLKTLFKTNFIINRILFLSQVPPSLARVNEILANCVQDNGINSLEIDLLLSNMNKSDIRPSENLKCFAKCVLDLSALALPNLGLDNIMAFIGISNGKDGKAILSGFERCKSHFKVDNTCEEAWSVYACINV